MAPSSEHLRVELLDRLAAGAHAQEGQQGMQQAREPGKDHPTPEIRGMQQVLPVGFAYGGRVFGEKSIEVHATHATHQARLRGCEAVAKSGHLRNNVAH
jgi:hypothetical protein